jgi:hypothetical protein
MFLALTLHRPFFLEPDAGRPSWPRLCRAGRPRGTHCPSAAISGGRPRGNFVTAYGEFRVAVTYTKFGKRVLPPLLAVDHPPAPTELRHAFRVIDNHVEDYLDQTRLRIFG